ncbi:hypothetical protein LCGC14_2707210 [marine sediment metagenome]|uniref:Uncharacterized protein n=1 Tax=marine sediment metagenome TaxID=412755 RepID=A0A0F8ZDZ3_9ZZZZ
MTLDRATLDLIENWERILLEIESSFADTRAELDEIAVLLAEASLI